MATKKSKPQQRSTKRGSTSRSKAGPGRRRGRGEQGSVRGTSGRALIKAALRPRRRRRS